MERAAEIALLLLPVWPIARLFAAQAFRRRLRAHPGRGLLVVGAAAGYAVAVALLAIGPPMPLRAAALMALAATLFAWWRARPDYGRRRGLPPGSLAATQLRPFSDDRFLLEQAREHGPVFKLARYGRPMACVVGLARGAELLRAAGDNLAPGDLPFSRLIPRGFLRYMTPEDHGHYRALLARALPAELVHDAAPRIAAAAERAFTRMAEDAQAVAGVAPRPYLRRFTFEALIELIFGLPVDDARAARMLTLYPDIDPASLAHIDAQRVRTAMAELVAIVRAAAAEATERMAAGRRPRCSLDLLARHEPGALSDPTLLGNLVYLVETGGGDLADLLTWVLKMLADHPSWWTRLQAETATGAAGGEDGLAARIIAETLRLEQSEAITRTARRPVSVDGYRIPAGWLVRICVRESHRDPTVFPEPDRFDPDRFLGNRYDSRSYAPLGLGERSCIGRALVQAAGVTVLVTLAAGFAWRAVADGPRELGTFHWAPSSRFRIAVEPRGG